MCHIGSTTSSTTLVSRILTLGIYPMGKIYLIDSIIQASYKIMANVDFVTEYNLQVPFYFVHLSSFVFIIHGSQNNLI